MGLGLIQCVLNNPSLLTDSEKMESTVTVYLCIIMYSVHG